MSELDEQIDKALEELVFCGRDNIGVTDEAVLARKAIKALIANQVREARIEMYNFYGEPRCSQLHHSKKDQHALLEDCPVVCRIKELKGDNK